MRREALMSRRSVYPLVTARSVSPRGQHKLKNIGE